MESESEKCETLADIVAQMRGRGEDGRMDRHLWNEYADRIEAAAKRVVVSVGNAAALRAALVAIRDAARNFCHQILNSKYNDIMDEYKCRERGFPALLDLRYDAIPKANVALSAPARNCDVGTAEEQVERWQAFCDQFDDDCTGCPCDDAACASYTGCFARWAQTPYEEKEGGAE